MGLGVAERVEVKGVSGEEFLDKFNLFPVQRLAAPRESKVARS